MIKKESVSAKRAGKGKLPELVIERPVKIAMQVLTPGEQRAVGRAIGSAQAFLELAKRPGRVTKVSSAQGLSKMRVGPNLRLIFRQSPDRIEVLDLMERATLDRYAHKKPAAKQQHRRAMRVRHRFSSGHENT